MENKINGQEDIRSPFILKELSISNQKNNNTSKIHIKVEPIADGEVFIKLNTDKKKKLASVQYEKNIGKYLKNQMIDLEFPTEAFDDGYHFIEIGMGFNTDKPTVDKVGSYQTFPLYFQIKKGEIIEYGERPDVIFDKPPVIISRNETKVIPAPISDTNFVSTSSKSLNKSASAYRILVYIRGKVFYEQASEAYSFSTVNKGLPATRVWLDWDYDNDPSTAYTPYNSESEHIGYADTDMDGNFYFLFYFNSDHPASHFSNSIRLYGTAANDATFNGDRGVGAQWVPIDATGIIDISGCTTNVNFTVNPKISSSEGGALRYLYRARLFCINKLGFEPHGVRYYTRTQSSSSYFRENGMDGQNDIWTSVAHICFNRSPGSKVSYHEYGHFIEYDKVGYQYSSDYSSVNGHYFELETANNFAWTEGWAECYNAVCHDYWYSLELPDRLEHQERDYFDAFYEFLDSRQSDITPGYNKDNTKVEGAIACFMYSLFDSELRRAPNYTGDNDDLTLSGSYILNSLVFTVPIIGYPVGATRIEKFKNGIVNFCSVDLANSITSLYSSIILQSGNARSATPTSLNINAAMRRTLTWNDNTCPNTLVYQREGSSSNFTYYPVQNNESGFKIYRKQGGGTWDGTLNGYTLVATTGANITNWTDETYLIGTYSYVVVAYNSAGNSVPKAQATVNYLEGEIRSSVTMGGQIAINTSITVMSGVTLTIAPGTNLTFNNGVSLTVGSYGTLTANGTAASPITFDFVSPNATTQNGIKFTTNMSMGNINYCQIRNAYRGIYENGVSIGIYNTAISGCTDGIYLYGSSPTIQDCNIHNNSTGINLLYSSPVIKESYIQNNNTGIYCSSNSNPKIGNPSTQIGNQISGNSYGVIVFNNALPIVGNSTYGGYNNLVNDSYNLLNTTQGYVYAQTIGGVH